MNITLPQPLEDRLTPRAAALHLAIGLFVAEEVTLGQAAEAAVAEDVAAIEKLSDRGA